jgi:hypothetical protein
MATDEARVLTVRQPWAWAIIHGGKNVENRSWPTKHRGPLLIHAGSAFEPDAYQTVQPPPALELVHGAIIGVVELVDCVPDSDSEWAVIHQWHWCLRNPQPFDQAVPCPGKLGVAAPSGPLLVRARQSAPRATRPTVPSTSTSVRRWPHYTPSAASAPPVDVRSRLHRISAGDGRFAGECESFRCTGVVCTSFLRSAVFSGLETRLWARTRYLNAVC